MDRRNSRGMSVAGIVIAVLVVLALLWFFTGDRTRTTTVDTPGTATRPVTPPATTPPATTPPATTPPATTPPAKNP
jgi:hypothetical protein